MRLGQYAATLVLGMAPDLISYFRTVNRINAVAMIVLPNPVLNPNTYWACRWGGRIYYYLRNSRLEEADRH